MKLRSACFAIALTLGAGTASAADHAIGNLTHAGSFSGSISAIAAGTSIDDNWLFSLTGAHNELFGLLTSVFTSSAINSFNARLSGPNGYVADWEMFTGRPIQVGMFEGTLGAGSYALNVSGLATRATSYSLNLAAAAPVPEPATYAMMLAGLGMLGFMARRRLAS